MGISGKGSGAGILQARVEPENVMERRGASTFIGDLNCSRRKATRLQERIEQEDLMDVGTAEFTHRWGQHRCTIARVLTRGAGWDREKTWKGKQGNI